MTLFGPAFETVKQGRDTQFLFYAVSLSHLFS